MQRIVCDLPKSFELIAGGDTHIGSVMAHIDGVKKTCDYIASGKNRYFIHMGDWIEYIPTDDKRYNPAPSKYKTKEIISPTEQAQEAARLFMPIKDRILCGLIGNHERRYSRYGDLVRDIICRDLNIPYATFLARIIIQNKKRPMFNISAIHGDRIFKSNAKDYEQREGNKKAALKLYLQDQMADCAIQLCGHAHWIGIVPPSNILYFVDGEKGVKQHYLKGITHADYIPPDQRWYGCTGSSRKTRLDGYDDYAQVYPAADLGFIKIIVDNGEIVTLERFLI